MNSQIDCATAHDPCDSTRAAVPPMSPLTLPTCTDMTSLGKETRAFATDGMGNDQVLGFISFDGAEIAYRDQGRGHAVVLLHGGGGVDGLGQFGSFEHILPVLEKRREAFLKAFGKAPPLPTPDLSGRPGIIPPLLAAGARIILPDMRGCGASSKPRQASAYANSASVRDVIALIQHLRLDSVDVVGFSAGALTALRLLTLRFGAIRSAVIAGIGDYVVEGTTLDFPRYFPIPEHLPRPLTHRIWAEESARVLERGEIIQGHLASASVIAARILGADPRVMAAVIRGAIAEPMQVASLNAIGVPVLVLNGRADVANQNTGILLGEIRTASLAQCEGDHGSTAYEPTFHTAVLNFLRGQWSRKS